MRARVKNRFANVLSKRVSWKPRERTILSLSRSREVYFGDSRLSSFLFILLPDEKFCLDYTEVSRRRVCTPRARVALFDELCMQLLCQGSQSASLSVRFKKGGGHPGLLDGPVRPLFRNFYRYNIRRISLITVKTATFLQRCNDSMETVVVRATFDLQE